MRNLAGVRPLTFAQVSMAVTVTLLLACASASAQVATVPDLDVPVIRGPVAVDPPPPAPPPPTGYVWNVIWTDEPDQQAVRRLYPMRAYREDVSGEALVECLITSDGALTECRVVRETPVGYGFGEASIRVARDFTVAPLTRDGRPTDGMRIRRTIRWAR